MVEKGYYICKRCGRKECKQTLCIKCKQERKKVNKFLNSTKERALMKEFEY